MTLNKHNMFSDREGLILLPSFFRLAEPQPKGTGNNGKTAQHNTNILKTRVQAILPRRSSYSDFCFFKQVIVSSSSQVPWSGVSLGREASLQVLDRVLQPGTLICLKKHLRSLLRSSAESMQKNEIFNSAVVVFNFHNRV